MSELRIQSAATSFLHSTTATPRHDVNHNMIASTSRQIFSSTATRSALSSSPRISSRCGLRSTRKMMPSLTLQAPCRCWSSTPIARNEVNTAQYTVGSIDTQTYQTVSDRAMDRLTDYLEAIVEEADPDKDFDVEYSSGVLTLRLGEQGTYVINKQPPNKQIWLSSPTSGPKRYDYDPKHKVWFYARDGSLLRDLLNGELRAKMGKSDLAVDLGEQDNE